MSSHSKAGVDRRVDKLAHPTPVRLPLHSPAPPPIVIPSEAKRSREPALSVVEWGPPRRSESHPANRFEESTNVLAIRVIETG
jgi:hypothetical protein